METDEPTRKSPPAPDTKAVAVRASETGSTPVITAKGHGYNAEKILEIAFAEGVKVRQDKDLTELLDAFDVDCPVPLEALHAVSLILERVYAENKSMDQQGHIDAADSLTSDTASSRNAPGAYSNSDHSRAPDDDTSMATGKGRTND